MNYKLIIRPEAEAELEEAFAWYEQQVAGLGSQFLLAVDATINSLHRNPLQYPVVYKDIRRALMRRFPYQVFYVQNEMQIVIIAVFHGMRNPSIWQSRNYVFEPVAPLGLPKSSRFSSAGELRVIA